MDRRSGSGAVLQLTSQSTSSTYAYVPHGKIVSLTPIIIFDLSKDSLQASKPVSAIDTETVRFCIPMLQNQPLFLQQPKRKEAKQPTTAATVVATTAIIRKTAPEPPN